MDSFELLLGGIQAALTFKVLTATLIGVLVGLVIGVLPGLGGLQRLQPWLGFITAQCMGVP
jgi:TctA family transporter